MRTFPAQLGGEEEARDPHRLVDEDLLLRLVALAPDHDRLERHHGGLEIEHRLEKKRILERRERAARGLALGQRLGFFRRRHALEIAPPDFHQRHRRRRQGSLGVLHEKAEEDILHLLQARLAQDKHAEEDDDQDEPGRRTTHWRRK